MQFQKNPNLPPSLETSPGDTWTQSLVTNFLRITTGKIYWLPKARFLIGCSNFKLESNKIVTPNQKGGGGEGGGTMFIFNQN